MNKRATSGIRGVSSFGIRKNRERQAAMDEKGKELYAI